jgi:hypothetical protein
MEAEIRGLLGLDPFEGLEPKKPSENAGKKKQLLFHLPVPQAAAS